MALIACPDCRNEVSDKASSCPKCGHPIAPSPPPLPPPPSPAAPPQLIEQTSKGFKGLQAFGCLGMFVGLIMGCSRKPEYGVVLFLLAAVVWIFAVIGAWWEHG